MKEKEREREREREEEKYIAPPYGINNYCNKCYFNSVNQITSNIFWSKDWYFINKINKFGHQDKFFEKYKSLYWIKPSKVGDTVQSLIKKDFNNEL